MTESTKKKMAQITFKELLEKFADSVIKPLRGLKEEAKYIWPLHGYTLEVLFSSTSDNPTIPFVILQSSGRIVSSGRLDPENFRILGMDYPELLDLINLANGLTKIMEEEVNQSENLFEGYPPLILNEDINDQWVEHYHQKHSDTSYTKAVQEAVKQVKQSITTLQTILDKYSF